MSKRILSIQKLQVEFHTRKKTLHAIRGIDLDVYQGECLAIVGESGCGKSVLTKTLYGMLEENGSISNGKILFYDDRQVIDLATLKKQKEWEPWRGKKIATVFQDPMESLDPIMPIGKQIALVIRQNQKCTPLQAKQQAISLMKLVGIPHAEKRYYDYPFQYSGGMRQRIVIAIALSCRPQILICDEPTTALDVTIQSQILQLIKDLQKQLKFTTIFITHDLGVVANIADRVAVLYAGQVVEVGMVDEVFYDPRHPYTWALLSSLPQLAQKGKPLYSIGGTPPSLFNLIKGDAFAPRNDYALKIDTCQEPPFFSITSTHFAKTWLLDERAPHVQKPDSIQDLHQKMLSNYRV